MASPSAAAGRRRGLPKQMSSEDQALNMIAREAEARLAAKRAARAEARSIRMKELEKMQQEADEQADKEFEREVDGPTKKRITPRIAAPTSPTFDTNAATHVANDQQVLQLKETLRETEEKYRKAMVNIAQLDNERQALQYQVECLKDHIEDMAEKLENVTDELTHKCKEHNKLTREHENTEIDLKKCLTLLKDRERILDEHGINLDGTLVNPDESDGDGTMNPHLQITNNIDHSNDDSAERESLLKEIDLLKGEISDLKRDSESDISRKGLESMKPDGADFERSFVDVSDEADAIRDDSRHTGLYVNNNEKCDEFEVIDDGSQGSDIKHFEDKSFEQSGQSSLLSSVRVDGATESMESECPYEISIDMPKSEHKDEYDIVHMDESSKHTLDVTSLMDTRRSPSPDVTSDINVNKYLFSDEDDNDADSEAQNTETFSVNTYFASGDVTIVEETNTGNESVDTSPHDVSKIVELNYETIDSKELDASPQPNLPSDSLDRCSPYLEVEANSYVRGNDTFNEAFVDNDVSVEQTDIEGDETVLNIDVVPEVSDSVLSETTYSRGMLCSDDTCLVEKDDETVDANNETMDDSSISTPATEESELLKTIDDATKPAVIEACFFTDQKPFEVRTESLSEHDKVVNLYDQIAGETTSQMPDLEDGIPENATFGVFGVTGKVKSEETETDVAKPKKPECLLVRVESFNAPKTKLQSPEITVVNLESTEEISEEVNPVPKERKKKKKPKKKKGGNVDIEEVKSEISTVEPSQVDDVPTPSAPELLGLSTEVENHTNIQPSPSTKHSDIPKQFLDVSHELGESYSDTSDIERDDNPEGGGKKRQGSKKNNKKENCKTQ